MKKLFLAFLAFLTVVSAEISDANFKNAQTSQACKKILDGGYFASYIDDFVFYSDDNKTKYFLSVFREKKRYILFRDKLPIDTNEAEYIERGGSFTGEVNGIDFDMIEDETHFVTMFLMDNTPYMQYFSDDKRYIFEYDKKTNLFKEACLIKQVGEYEYK